MLPFRLGTRGSPLALAQAEGIAAALRRSGREVEVRVVVAAADLSPETPVPGLRSKGVFVRELEEEVLRGALDAAVHSLKDLPSDLPTGLRLGATPPREDPRDVLIASGGRRFDALEPGATVATGSARRVAQLRRMRADLSYPGARGNVDTRIRRVAEGRWAAVVLARAGLLRLGREAEASETFEPEQILPAPGQGILAVECRADDRAAASDLAPIEDAATRVCADAERALMRAVQGGCLIPLGALAEARGGEMRLRGVLCSPDGAIVVAAEMAGPAASFEELAARVGRRLLDGGGREIVSAARAQAGATA